MQNLRLNPVPPEDPSSGTIFPCLSACARPVSAYGRSERAMSVRSHSATAAAASTTTGARSAMQALVPPLDPQLFGLARLGVERDLRRRDAGRRFDHHADDDRVAVRKPAHDSSGIVRRGRAVRADDRVVVLAASHPGGGESCAELYALDRRNRESRWLIVLSTESKNGSPSAGGTPVAVHSTMPPTES